MIASQIVLANDGGWLLPVPEYDFHVVRSWKGEAAGTVHLRGGYDNCASIFSAGSSYLVYASPHSHAPHVLSSSKCSATKDAAGAAADFVALGRPMVVVPSLNMPKPSRAGRGRAYLVAGIAVYGNALRDAMGPASRAQLSRTSIVLMLASGVGVLSGLLLMKRHRRLGTAMLILSPLVLVGALMTAGEVFFRNSWFAQYLM